MNSLPDNVLFDILSFISPRYISEVSKQWRQLLKNYVSRLVLRPPSNISNDKDSDNERNSNLFRLLEKHSEVTSLAFKGSLGRGLAERMQQIDNLLTKLKKAKFGYVPSDSVISFPFHQLTSIHISVDDDEDMDLILSNNPQLEELITGGCSSDEAFTKLSSMKHLKRLFFNTNISTKVTITTYRAICQLSLELVGFDQCWLPFEFSAEFGKSQSLKGLRGLVLTQNIVRDDFFLNAQSSLHYIGSLELVMWSNFTDDSMKIISQVCKFLQSLILKVDQLTDKGISYICGICHDTQSDPKTTSSINGGLKYLQRLDILSLIFLTDLTYLYISKAPFRHQLISLAVHHSGLRHESLQYLITPAESTSTSTSTKMRTFPKLKSLNIYSYMISDESLIQLQLIADQLTSFSLFDHRTGEAELISLLKNATQLRSIDISKCYVTDETLSCIASSCHRSLEKIILHDCCKITKEGIVNFVRQCHNLKEIFTPIRDNEVIEELRRLSIRVYPSRL